MSGDVPVVSCAIIGGSSTFSMDFPSDLSHSEIEMLETGLVVDTPYGASPDLDVWSFRDRKVLSCRMHGWRPGVVSRSTASQQLFWVFKEAGVRQILAEGGVGCIHQSLSLRDFVIVDDYIDHSQRSDVSLDLPYLLVMRDPFCPSLRACLFEAAAGNLSGSRRRVHKHGVYLTTDGRHFESRAEVRAYRQWGADVIGQSVVPEVYLAREIGACYAGIYMIVNAAEGVGGDWDHGDLTSLFYGEATTMGKILLDALSSLPEPSVSECRCRWLRKPTLLDQQSSP
ncbi:MTAP family purine nucleoside phosphorylase [Pasteuria penetrans]|uniref:MTAP family purine nucleoside phosphorylase n=1 Tax=Pasteuria penetrans TaxID=86005 RepID=UPI000F98A293|nr:MTAP family purine nucleoside phosphorylase [Pasteuria penetrans]